MPTGLKRYYGQGHLHFITFSCYRRLPLLRSVRARNVFVTELGKARDEMGFLLIGYVVMPDHVHMLMSEPKQGTPSAAAETETTRRSQVAKTKKASERRATGIAARRDARTVAGVLAGAVSRFQCVQPSEEA